MRPERDSSTAASATPRIARDASRRTRAFSPAVHSSDPPDGSRVLVIGCGALAEELVAVIDQAGLSNVDLTCLTATLHNRPGGIPGAVREKIRAARPRYARIFIAYADCGTGGLLDAMLADEGVDRLPGAHCYEFFSGSAAFAAMTDVDPATFFLTDFLARNFERLVIKGLGLDRHPELLSTYFGNYRRLIYLAQTDDPALVRAANRAARRLGLTFEVRHTGYGDLGASVAQAARDGHAAQDEKPAQAGLASDARMVGTAAPMAAVQGQNVHPAQEVDEILASSRGSLRQTQEARSPRAPRRRLVHLAQGVDETLHQAQGSATSGRLRAAGMRSGRMRSGRMRSGRSA